MKQEQTEREQSGKAPKVRYKKTISYSCKLEALRKTGLIKQMPCSGACGEQVLFCAYGVKHIEKTPYVKREFFDREDDE